MDKLKLRRHPKCPKCKRPAQTLIGFGIVSEEFNVSSDGTVIDAYRSGNDFDPTHVECVCACGYTWTARKMYQVFTDSVGENQ